MITPVLALAPVPMVYGTGAGASTGTAGTQGHRYHLMGESTAGKQEGQERGRLTALPGRTRPLSPSYPAPGHHASAGCQ